MIDIFKRQYSIMILYAVTLHFIWGVLGLYSADAYNSTALHGLHLWFGSWTPYLCFLVAVLAFIAVLEPRPMLRLVLSLPQQAALVLSAGTAVKAVTLSQFADGVIRPWEFIAADQAPAIIAAIGHTIAIVRMALKK